MVVYVIGREEGKFFTCYLLTVLCSKLIDNEAKSSIIYMRIATPRGGLTMNKASNAKQNFH